MKRWRASRTGRQRSDATSSRTRRLGLAASVAVVTAAAVVPIGFATVLAPPAAAATGSKTYTLDQAGAYQLALTPDGTAYITHYTEDPNGTISRVTDAGVVTHTVASVSKYALGIVADHDGRVYSAQQSDSTISRIAPDGTVEAAWVTLPTNPHPYALAIDPDGNLYTANANRRTVSKVTPAGVPTDPWGSEPSVPTGIAADPLGGVMTTNDDGSVSRFAPDGTRTVVRGPQATTYIVGIAFAPDGTAYVVDSDETVTRIPHGGAPQTAWATIPGAPLGIAVDGLGNVYVSYPDAIAKIHPDRTMEEEWATFPAQTFPIYLAANDDGSRIWSVSMTGIIRVAQFFPPAAVGHLDVTGKNGALAVSFDAPSDDGGSTVSGYEVSTDGGTTWASLATTNADGRLTALLSTTSAGGPLVNGTRYDVAVRAVNDAGPGARSATVTASPAAPPAPPAPAPPVTRPGSPIDVTVVPGDRQATVSWTPPADDGGAPITGYTVVATAEGRSVAAADAATGTTGLRKISGISTGMRMVPAVTAALRAVGAVQKGGRTAVAPGGGSRVVTATGRGARISAIVDTAATAGALSCYTTGTFCTVTGLTNGVGYRFTVTATNSAGTSTPTVVAPVVPTAETAAPAASPAEPPGSAEAPGAADSATTGTTVPARAPATGGAPGRAASSSGGLAYTGFAAVPVLLLGFLLVAGGVLAVVAARRRPIAED